MRYTLFVQVKAKHLKLNWSTVGFAKNELDDNERMLLLTNFEIKIVAVNFFSSINL